MDPFMQMLCFIWNYLKCLFVGTCSGGMIGVDDVDGVCDSYVFIISEAVFFFMERMSNKLLLLWLRLLHLLQA